MPMRFLARGETTFAVIKISGAGSRYAHDGEFARCIASAGRDRDGRFAEVHLGKIPHQRLVERLIKTGSNDLRFEQRGNPLEPFEQFAQISGQIRHANPSYRRLRLPRKQWKVLGVDLNRSKSGRDATELAPMQPPQPKAHPVRRGTAALRDFRPAYVGSGSMLLKKDYEGGLLATLIQDQEQMRNHDLRNHLPGFGPFQFLIPQLFGDFFNSIDPERKSRRRFCCDAQRVAATLTPQFVDFPL